MFNMLNARKIENEVNVFDGLFKSNIFWVIWVAIAGFQVRLNGTPAAVPACGAHSMLRCAVLCYLTCQAGSQAVYMGHLLRRPYALGGEQATETPRPACLPQVLIMFFLGGIFKVERLTGLEWLISVLIGLGSLPVCLLSKAATK